MLPSPAAAPLPWHPWPAWHTGHSRPARSPLAVSSPVFGPRQVHGVLGGSATVKCFYPPTLVNRRDRKYWCKESGSRCATVVATGFVAQGYEDRVSLTDHPEAESFQVNISALGLGDAGSYQCGVGVNGRGLSYRVALSVAEGNHRLPKTPFSFSFPPLSLSNKAPPMACPVSESCRCSVLSGKVHFSPCLCLCAQPHLFLRQLSSST